MGRPIILNWGGREHRFGFEKLERAQLYGQRQRVMMAQDGRASQRAELVREGDVILRPGMSAQGFLDEAGRLVRASERVGLDPSGQQALPKEPSTLGRPQPLEGPVPPQEALDLAVETVYRLESELVGDELRDRLLAGDIYRFPFHYRADHNPSEALLVATDQGFFALIGRQASPHWCSLDQPLPQIMDEEPEEELDFQMF